METSKEIKIRNMELKKAIMVISICVFLFPSFFSSFSTYIYKNNINMYIVQVAALIIGIIASSSNYKITINRGDLNFEILCISIFILQLVNNGDIEHGLQNYVILTAIELIFVNFFIAQNENAAFGVCKPVYIFSLVHLISGFYFYFNPDRYRDIANRYFNLTDRTETLMENGLAGGWFFSLTDQLTLSGIYMSIAVLISFCAFLNGKVKREKNVIYNVIISVLAFAGLALTGKRAPFVFTILSVVVVYLISYVGNNRRTVTIKILTGLFAVTLGYLIFIRIPAFQSMISKLELAGAGDTSASIRHEYIEAAVSLFKQNPIFGIGWRQFRYTANNVSGNDVHNVYLQLLTETGMFGFMIFISFFAMNYVRTFKLIYNELRKTDVQTYLPIYFSLGYQTFFLLYCFTGNPLYDIQLRTLYFVCCGVTQCYRLRYRYQ